MTGTATDLVVTDHRQATFDHIENHRANLLAFAVVIDIYPHLFKAHERPHADAADHQALHLMGSEQLDRHHAPALDMLLIGDNRNLFDLPILEIHQGENISMPKMPCAQAVETTLSFGRN